MNIIYKLLLILLLISCSQDEDMRLFQTSLGSDGGSGPSIDLPIADDGYLYIYAAGQSNMVGTYPLYPNGFTYTGNMTNPTKTFIPAWENNGTWINATYQNIYGYSSTKYSNNIMLTFCREIENDYPDLLGIKVVFIAVGATEIENWIPPLGGQWIRTEDAYDSFSSSDIRPASIWLWHQGEQNDSDDYVEYGGKMTEVRNGLVSAGYLVSDHIQILGELARDVAFNNVLLDIANENVKYKLAHSDGVQKGDIVHFLGEGLENMGNRYLERLYEVTKNNPVPDDLIRPNRINKLEPMTVTNLTASGFTLSWPQGITDNTNRTIVGYNIYSQNGWIFYAYVDGINNLSLDVLHTFSSGETEYWNVQAVDDIGNVCEFYSSNVYSIEIIVP